MRYFSVLAAVTATMVTTAHGQGNFGNSCTNSLLQGDGNTLAAFCPDNGGNFRISEEDLNLCLANGNGVLVARNNGGYKGSCSNCSYSGTTITCTCLNGGQQKITSSFDLNRIVSNQNGHLLCFGHFGTK